MTVEAVGIVVGMTLVMVVVVVVAPRWGGWLG